MVPPRRAPILVAAWRRTGDVRITCAQTSSLSREPAAPGPEPARFRLSVQAARKIVGTTTPLGFTCQRTPCAPLASRAVSARCPASGPTRPGSLWTRFETSRGGTVVTIHRPPAGVGFATRRHRASDGAHSGGSGGRRRAIGIHSNPPASKATRHFVIKELKPSPTWHPRGGHALHLHLHFTRGSRRCGEVSGKACAGKRKEMPSKTPFKTQYSLES